VDPDTALLLVALIGCPALLMFGIAGMYLIYKDNKARARRRANPKGGA
jgi:hypothetical protein